MKNNFRFAPDILSRLGEELIPNPEQGIIELVKNSYDADARECTVKLEGTDSEGGTIYISDDGIGMDAEAINNGWLVIGRSRKTSSREPTEKYGRFPVGDKGIGRLAALRLGRQVILKTRPEREPGIEYTLNIDWRLFEKADVVEDVSLQINRNSTDKPSGTDIIVSDLQDKLGRRETKRLARELILLADPFNDRFGFQPKLITSDFKDLEARVRDAYFDDAEYYLEACLDKHGNAKARLLDWKDNELFRAGPDDLSSTPYNTAAATFELWVFILDSKTFSTRQATIKEVRNWLSVVGGVHLYHRGLRVRPYGDKGHDWLEMNLARARSPEERPSTNTSIGRVIVDDPSDILIQKTDRVGFIENEDFLELRRFAIDALDWMAKVRLKMAEKRRERVRKEAPKNVEEAEGKLDVVIEDTVPAESRPIVRDTIKEYQKAIDRNIKALREDLQLYRSLATAGTTAAVFAHESSKPVTLIKKLASVIETRGRGLLGDTYQSSLEKPVLRLNQTADALKSFAQFPIHLLEREKRRSGIVDVHAVIEDIYNLFHPFLEDAKIEVVQDKIDRKAFVFGSVALLEAIIANLLTNTVNAFNEEDARIEGRMVIVRTELSGEKNLVLRIIDNGPGIRDIPLDEIWLPGRTTTPGGTGFGLTIVKDSVEDLSGSVYAIANGELGGAEFIIQLPLAGSN